jgi:hypothetical protein
MNLCISLSKINTFLNSPKENAYFLFFMERKRNIIMDGGYFTKISISNSFFTMNGIYTIVTITQKLTDDGVYGIENTKNKYDQLRSTPSLLACSKGTGVTSHTEYEETPENDKTHLPLGNTFRPLGVCRGLHSTIPINEPSVSYPTTPQNSTKYYIYFDPYTLSNRTITESIIQLEETILQMYGVVCPNKTPVHTLKNQLHNGVFKIHQVLSTNMPAIDGCIFMQQNTYILKISGVWENAHNYGITYKCTLP